MRCTPSPHAGPSPRARRARRRARLHALAAAGAAVLALSGCRVGGERSVEAENDRLRAENRDLRERVTTLELREKELQALSAELASRNASSQANAGESASESHEARHDEILAATPRVAVIELGATPAIVWSEGRAASVSIAVGMLDGRARFTQAVGTLRVEAFSLPGGVRGETFASLGGASGEAGSVASVPGAQLVASISLAPLALRDAYRSSFTGTHYAAELTPDTPLDPGTTLAIAAQFDDAVTGQRHRAQRLVTIPSAPKPR